MPLPIKRSAIVLPSTCAPALFPARAVPDNCDFSAGSVLDADSERLAGHVVDHLCVDVRHAPEHTQPWPLGRAGDPLALPEGNALTAILLGVDLHRYFAPVLPAFFFSTSPV